MFDKLRIRLMVSFLLITIVPLVLVGGITAYQSADKLEGQSVALQREVVARVSREFTAFIDQRVIELQLLDELLGFALLDIEAQRSALDGLLMRNQHYQELLLLEASGQERIRISRTRVILGEELINRGGEVEFIIAAVNQEIYYGPIRFDSNIREPLLRIAVPIVARRTDETRFVLMAEFRVQAIWDILARIELPDSIDVYILNADDLVVAHKNPSTVLQNTKISSVEPEGQSRSPDGKEVILVRDSLLLGQQALQVVAMQPIVNAHQLATDNMWVVISITITAILFALVIGVQIAHQLVKPIEHLARQASKVGQGDLTIQFVQEGRGEVRELGVAFQEMTTRLNSIIADLEQAKQGATELAQVTLESIGDAVITTNVDGLVNYLNPVARKLTGWSLGEACGRPLSKVFHVVNDSQDGQAGDPAVLCMAISPPITSVLINRHGRECAVQHSTAPIRGQSGNILGVVLVFTDVTNAHERHKELSYQASHDALTGLVNRREFESRLERVLISAHSEKSEHVLCYLDLDHFKRVNDTCGHEAGDALLCEVSELLTQHFRKRDTLARLGGDEFGVLLEHCTLEQALRMSRLLHKSIQSFQFNWQSHTFSIGISIGLAAVNDKVDSASVALKNADSACYAAKNSGRNRSHVYVKNVEEGTRRVATADR